MASYISHMTPQNDASGSTSNPPDTKPQAQSILAPPQANGTAGGTGAFTIRPITISPDARAMDSQSSTELQINDETRIATIAKGYKPICVKLVSVIDTIGVRTVTNTAHKYGYSEDAIEEIEEKVAMSPDTHDLIATSSSRIAARYITDPLQMDILGLIGGLSEWAWTLGQAIAELKKNPPSQPDNVIEASRITTDLSPKSKK